MDVSRGIDLIRAQNGNHNMRNDILVIDDANLHLSIASRIATQAGFATTGAHSVAEAAKLLRARTFDCITLGEESGVEVLKLLGEMKCRTPIVIISGSEDSVRQETIRIGNFFDLNLCPPIPKPIDLAVLRGTLSQIATDTQRQKRASAAGW